MFGTGKIFLKLLFFSALLSCFAGSACGPVEIETVNPAPTAWKVTPNLATAPSPIAIAIPTAAPTSPAKPVSTPSSTPTLKILPGPTTDLSRRPLVWFNPLPPMQTFPGRPYIGSVDFMDLFVPEAKWKTAASKVQVFELYGEWLGRDATDQQLRQLVYDLDQRGIAIALAGGALTPVGNCTGAIEGFAGITEGTLISRRIREAGGTATFYAFDHAYDAGTASTTPPECRLSPEEIAQQVLAFQKAIRKIFPDIIFGDDITARLDVGEVTRWVEAYRSVTGADLGFLHVDVDFGIPDWEQKVLQIEDYLHSEGIPFGIFYLGNNNDPSDEAWLTSAGERVKAYELDTGGNPDHVIFASWHDHPDHLLPETEPNTFTNFITLYFKDRGALGVQTGGPGANLAYGKRATASNTLPGFPLEQAVDGIFSTWWGAGDFAPQWIEIDLGAEYAVALIRLGISQDPAGDTRHQVWGWGMGEEARLLYEFEGMTRDEQVLEYTPPEPWQGIQYIRIVTLASPSWVSWREIEVIAAD